LQLQLTYRQKRLFFLQTCFVLWTGIAFTQDVRIHSHNDYHQAEPLYNAVRNQAWSIEADIYLVGDKILVAHDTEELATAPSLEDLYLRPIQKLFKQNRGRISRAKDYAPVLMIDIKSGAGAALPALVRLIEPYLRLIHPVKRKNGIKIIISGNRGTPDTWLQWPEWLSFDGRPGEIYSGEILQRVGLISDSYSKYKEAPDEILSTAQRVHGQSKLLRIWGAPDEAQSWVRLKELGVDILNTDRVTECRRYFEGME
jgi:alkaline phosphatase